MVESSEDTGTASHQPVSEESGPSPLPPSNPQPAGRDAAVGPSDTGVPVAEPRIASGTPAAPSWSASGERQPGHGQGPGSETSDLVFPIRSVVSVDPRNKVASQPDYFPRVPDHGAAHIAPRPLNPRIETTPEIGARTASPTISIPSADALGGVQPPVRRKNTAAGPFSSVQADAARHGPIRPLALFTEDDEDDGSEKSHNSESIAGAVSLGGDSAAEQEAEPMVTTRFRHLLTDEGHAVITGRDGILQRCEDEPIHTPGAVQGFGALIAIREVADGRFVVRYASENSERIIGYSPRQLFRLDNFLAILSEDQQDNLLDHIDFIRDEDADPAINGPEVFSLSVRPPKKKGVKLWCAIHINPVHPDLIICEFELDDDHDHPLRPSDELTPDIPEDTLQSNPTLEELTESTEILSRPLRVLRSARKKRGEAGAMQVFDIMSQVQEQLASAPNLERFLKILVGIVKELTGFHRVMIYQFDSSFNGKVVTELVDTTHTLDLYKGLHFPASDIPRQARDLYKLNKVRLLYDRDLESARLVCRAKEDLDVPLDMSHAYLRAMSPIHLKYLANMAVRSSMSISINAFNELWGLIACHSYGPNGMRVSFPIRKMCRLVGDTASRNIERLSYASRLQARKLINTAPTEKNPSGYIIASSDDLLKLFDADFGMLSIQGETKILGRITQSQEALAMLEYLRMRKLTSVTMSQDIREDFPDLRYPPGFAVIAGILCVPLSVGGGDFIVFFRRGQAREVKWAGNPYEKLVRDGTQGYLEPRTSFKTWHETVIGKCREWSEEQVETAAVLCLVYGKFIEVWRQKEAALQSSRLTRLLLANSAHEVRTPLNAIINYLEIALEGTLDGETRDNLAKSHSASKSLIYVINDLLDLTKTEEGQNLIKNEIFELSVCIREAVEPFKVDARRKGIDYEIIEHPGIPRRVHGDGRRVRQAVSNITANAFQHTTSGSVRVEWYVAEILAQHVLVEVIVEDTGAGMTTQQLDTLFRDLEQVSTDPSIEDTAMSPESASGEGRTLGLGLATVARVVRNMEGQLRLKSEEGKGSRFVIQLPFDIPEASPDIPGDPSHSPGSTAGQTSLASITTALPTTHEGEIMLVDRGSTSALNADVAESAKAAETASITSGASKGSANSARSDADRLIDAIQTPLSIGDKTPVMQRRTSYEYPTAGSPESAEGRRARGPGQIKAPEPVGFVPVPGAKTPIKPVKMPDDYFDLSLDPQQRGSSGILFEITGKAADELPTSKQTPSAVSTSGTESSVGGKLRILVAEDDPINLRVLQKRLERVGHEIFHAVNGEDCSAMYRESSSKFDVILMDMQMPIVDGLTSTKMIRSHETSSGCRLSTLAGSNGRIPIVAVSASLLEKHRDEYIGAGFDGWILKPIDFKRLHTLLLGISDDDIRTQCLYKPGQWEQGGWFGERTSNQAVKSDGKSEPKE